MTTMATLRRISVYSEYNIFSQSVLHKIPILCITVLKMNTNNSNAEQMVLAVLYSFSFFFRGGCGPHVGGTALDLAKRVNPRPLRPTAVLVLPRAGGVGVKGGSHWLPPSPPPYESPPPPRSCSFISLHVSSVMWAHKKCYTSGSL